MIVVAVVCIVEREEANGRPAVETAANARVLSDESLWRAQKHVPFLRLFSANDVRVEHLRQFPPEQSEASPR